MHRHEILLRDNLVDSDCHVRQGFAFFFRCGNILLQCRIVIATVGDEVLGVRLRVPVESTLAEYFFEKASANLLVSLLFLPLLRDLGH